MADHDDFDASALMIAIDLVESGGMQAEAERLRGLVRDRENPPASARGPHERYLVGKIVLDPMPGCDIAWASRYAADIARLTSTPVHLNFNGLKFTINPGDSPGAAADSYWRSTGRTGFALFLANEPKLEFLHLNPIAGRSDWNERACIGLPGSGLAHGLDGVLTPEVRPIRKLDTHRVFEGG